VIFSFFRKKALPPQPPELKVDLHSHLIPGIDDGAQNMEESLTLLKALEAMGYKKVITTPHIMMDAYRNNSEIILSGLEKLKKAAKEEGISLDIEAAAEHYLDEGFYDHLYTERVMSIEGKYLLFETSYISKPMQMEEMIFEIGSAGFTPLLAHPERYRYVKAWREEYTRWKELGVYFQVNLNSLGGHYGKDAQEKALFLSSEGMIDFLGSDTHHQKHVETLQKVLQSEHYAQVYQKNRILNNTLYE